MRKTVCALLGILILISLCGCSSSKQDSQASDQVTVKQLLENKEFPEEKTMTVTIKSIVNPAVAVVEDDSGASVNLWGVFVDGEFKEFEAAGIEVGMSITIKNGKYNEFEGSVEIAEAELVSIN